MRAQIIVLKRALLEQQAINKGLQEKLSERNTNGDDSKDDEFDQKFHYIWSRLTTNLYEGLSLDDLFTSISRYHSAFTSVIQVKHTMVDANSTNSLAKAIEQIKSQCVRLEELIISQTCFGCILKELTDEIRTMLFAIDEHSQHAFGQIGSVEFQRRLGARQQLRIANLTKAAFSSLETIRCFWIIVSPINDTIADEWKISGISELKKEQVR